MKTELQLVRGAVATKDLIPILTHFHFYDGRVQGGNGSMCIDSPIDVGYPEPFTVPAKPFLRAVDACGGAPNIALDEGRLKVSKSRFRVKLDLAAHDEYPRVTPIGEMHDASADALTSLLPFVSVDASRPWSRGMLVDDGYAYATNNVVLVQKPIEFSTPRLNIPGTAVAELQRIGRSVSKMMVASNSVTFQLGEAWVYTRLYDLDWPDAKSLLQSRQCTHALPQGIVEAVETVLPFAQDASFPVVELSPGGVACNTAHVDLEIPGLDRSILLAAEPLLGVLRVAERMDYEGTVIAWEGAGMRGVIATRYS